MNLLDRLSVPHHALRHFDPLSHPFKIGLFGGNTPHKLFVVVGCWMPLDVIVLAVGCCCWLLDAIGCCCWMLDVVGCHWMLLLAVGCCWMPHGSTWTCSSRNMGASPARQPYDKQSKIAGQGQPAWCNSPITFEACASMWTRWFPTGGGINIRKIGAKSVSSIRVPMMAMISSVFFLCVIWHLCMWVENVFYTCAENEQQVYFIRATPALGWLSPWM